MPDRERVSALTLDAIMGFALDAVIAVDTEGVIVAWNFLATTTFGWADTEAVGRNLGDLIVPTRYRAAHRAGLERFQETGLARVVGRRIEIYAVDLDAREFPIELSIIQAPPGGRAAFIGFLRDISDRRAAQSLLVLSEASLRLATEAAEVGTWDLDLITNELTWSDRTKAMFGVSPNVPCSMDDFYGGLHPDDLDATSKAFASALDPVIRAVYDVQYRTVGKEDRVVRWVAAKGKGIFDSDGRCIRAVGTAIDISAQKAAIARQAFMLEIVDVLRGGETSQALETACAALGRYFGASRVGYGQLDPYADIFRYTVCWTDGSVPPLLGDHPAHAFGVKIVKRLSAGKTVAVGDLFSDNLSDEAETRQTASNVDTRAILVVPFLRGSRLRTIIYLNDRNIRRWSVEDVAVMEEVAERLRQVIERADAEAALAASEAEFRTFAQAMPNQVWASAPDGNLNWFNERVYAYGGARPGELDGDGWVAMVHPDDVSAAAEKWRAALQSGETYETEFRLRRHDGAYRWHLGRALPILDPDGKIGRWIGTNTDIEDQKATSEALARLNATLEQEVAERTADRDRVWRNSQDLLVIVDSSGIFRAVSPSVEAILGWIPNELEGQKAVDFIVEQDQASTTEAIAVAAVGRLEVYENRYRHKDGGFRWLSWVAAPEEGLIYGSGRDITQEKAAAEELARTQDALRQSQKMEAVGQLTGGIAHDFNNMLAVVIGSLDLLRRRVGGEDARSRRYIEAAVEGAQRAATLTQRLLAFSRQQPLKPEPTDLNKLVAGMSDLLRHSLGTDVRLEAVLGGGLWRANVDPNQLENVILNLAVNARDAMPEGGRLTIETQNAHLDERYVAREPGLSMGQYVLVAISDTGSGMPADVIAKAFDPFFTTKPVGKGTGLGLSQVYGFIKQSGGHVNIYSEVGEGTTIKVYLPRLLGSDRQAPSRHASVDLPLGDEQELVLVVEDEPAVRRFSVEALGELGYQVLEADGARAAFQLLDAHPNIALLFTDIVMPDVNGRKLADEARRRRPGLKVLFTTGYTRNAVVHNGILDPGVVMIGKPFTIEQLAAKVRQVLDSDMDAVD
jgi:PAS domain S-box-containing protein